MFGAPGAGHERLQRKPRLVLVTFAGVDRHPDLQTGTLQLQECPAAAIQQLVTLLPGKPEVNLVEFFVGHCSFFFSWLMTQLANFTRLNLFHGSISTGLSSLTLGLSVEGAYFDRASRGRVR